MSRLRQATGIVEMGTGGGGEGIGLGQGGGSGSSSASTQGDNIAGASGVKRSRVPRTVPGLRVEVGEFVVYTMPPGNTMSVTVGKVLEMQDGVDGKEVLLHWFTPKRVDPKASRLMYRKEGWSAEYVFDDGK